MNVTLGTREMATINARDTRETGPLLPWCTDPDSGWMGSTTLRVRKYPPGATRHLPCQQHEILSPYKPPVFTVAGVLWSGRDDQATSRKGHYSASKQPVRLANAMALKIGRYDTSMIAFQPYAIDTAMAQLMGMTNVLAFSVAGLLVRLLIDNGGNLTWLRRPQQMKAVVHDQAYPGRRGCG